MDLDANDPHRILPPVRIPANVRTFYLEELVDVTPTPIAYDHEEAFWWNIAFFHDNLSQSTSGTEPLQKFVRASATLLSNESSTAALGQSFYIKPSTVDGGCGSVQTSCVCS